MPMITVGLSIDVWRVAPAIPDDQPQAVAPMDTLVTDCGMTGHGADDFDAGIRLGDIVSKNMIAVPINGDVHFAVAGAPSWVI